jgi:hypothetical protein
MKRKNGLKHIYLFYHNYNIMKLPFIPVSFGELFDKYTILQIKHMNIKDDTKLIFIQNEINYLTPFINTALDVNNITHILQELTQINEQLWDIEDKIREKEHIKEFNQEFIDLARNVYITNDKRNKLKRKIDEIFHSELSDIKSYV